jgi:hypothetical protein
MRSPHTVEQRKLQMMGTVQKLLSYQDFRIETFSIVL